MNFFSQDIKEFVFENNKMHMPDDFYEIIEFCRSIDSKNPKSKYYFTQLLYRL